MIDIAYEVQKFNPVDISSIPLDDKYGENVRLAFALYNKAIQKISDGYEDLARIDLKKAIQLNPEFYVAIILLGVCTFANGDRIGAVRIFNSVKATNIREKALNYLDYLANEMDRAINHREVEHAAIREEEMFSVQMQDGNEGTKSFDKFEVFEVDDIEEEVILKIEPFTKVTPEIKQEVIKEEPILVTKINEEVAKPKETTVKKEIKKEVIQKDKVQKVYVFNNKTIILLSYAVAITIIIVLCVIAISIKSENIKLKDSLSLYADSSGNTTFTPTPTVGNTTSTPEINTPTSTPVDYYALTESQVKDCIRNYNFKQYYSVVEVYHTIKMDYVPDAQKENLKNIYEKSLENFSKQNYSYSFTLTSQKKHEEVIDILLPIFKYNTDFTSIDGVVFYIGQSYEALKNKSKAKEYYNIVVDKYPASDYAKWAGFRLKEIG